MDSNEANNIDLLSQIYNEMNETGKEKLKEVSDLILTIWNTVNAPYDAANSHFAAKCHKP
jgi:hypothetical protein